MARSLPQPSARAPSDGAVYSPRFSVPLPDMPLCFIACHSPLYALFPTAPLVYPRFSVPLHDAPLCFAACKTLCTRSFRRRCLFTPDFPCLYTMHRCALQFITAFDCCVPLHTILRLKSKKRKPSDRTRQMASVLFDSFIPMMPVL